MPPGRGDTPLDGAQKPCSRRLTRGRHPSSFVSCPLGVGGVAARAGELYRRCRVQRVRDSSSGYGDDLSGLQGSHMARQRLSRSALATNAEPYSVQRLRHVRRAPRRPRMNGAGVIGCSAGAGCPTGSRRTIGGAPTAPDQAHRRRLDFYRKGCDPRGGCRWRAAGSQGWLHPMCVRPADARTRRAAAPPFASRRPAPRVRSARDFFQSRAGEATRGRMGSVARNQITAD